MSELDGSNQLNPGNIYCMGRNHPELPITKRTIENQSKEVGRDLGISQQWPILSSKATSSIGTSNSVIPFSVQNREIDWEAELVVEIGKECFALESKEEAHKVITRWGVGNDITDRWWQRRDGGQWIRGKSFPGFAPLIFNSDSFSAARNNELDREIRCLVNGKLVQHGVLSEMISSPVQIVWQISQCLQLLKGDLIFCGTFPGSALNSNPSTYLKIGDEVTTEIEGLGKLNNKVVKA